ncbi:TIGR03899 family protein [Cupriavidus metallidurans]|jgi:uncharacterized repeat protein (TIGR03899 family)|uniref:TIGR03899 family protein n=1 Tax=Cupriavidus metallidurans TaxID=119219 RepID=UPI001BFC17DA|nr:TIGR03899 family protein [Cupriavidus metallidurans]QWC87183.1 TIGR03899 family protein [Cupriavidus metallidurans]
MEDLLGLGKGAEKLISVVERAIGAVYRPYGIKREADAEDYRRRLLDAAKRDARGKNIVESAKATIKADIILAEGRRDLEMRMQARLRHEALREQQNIENVVVGAFENIQPDVSAENVDDDWIAGFFEHVRTVSNTEMQALWSSVLALEVGAPGSFSPRSLNVLRKMTRREAGAFQVACQLASSMFDEASRRSIFCGAYRPNWMSVVESPKIELSDFGLSFLDRVNLSNIGLIYEDELVNVKGMPRGSKLLMRFASTRLSLVAKRDNIKLNSYSMTPVGSELSALIAPEENSEYIVAMRDSLSKFFDISDAD